jgi:beta-glucosidase
MSLGADDAKLLVTSVPIVTVLEGIRRRVDDGVTVLYERGCPIAETDRSGIEAAVRAATEADVAVVVVGDQAGLTAFGTVGEGLDSTDCALPGVQRELVEAVVATGTPTVVVLSHGRAFVLGWMADTVPSIVSSFFGGEEAGSAIAAVLFGDVNPAGRTPVAFLRSAGAAPVTYGRATNQTDSYVDGSAGAVFPFGHGLSYTTFEYSDFEIETEEVPTDGVVRLSCTVSNKGDRPGDEVVQLYGRDMIARTVRPLLQLVGFRRLQIQPATSARVTFEVPTTMFALWDITDGWVVEPGLLEFYVGSSSSDIRHSVRGLLIGGTFRAGPNRELSSRATVDESR